MHILGDGRAAAACLAHAGCMSQHSTTPNKDYRFDSAPRLARGLEALLGAANLRQVWILFFDREHRLLEPLIPLNEITEDPDELIFRDKFGRTPFTHELVDSIESIGALVRATSFVLVWERPGDAQVTLDDRAWGHAAERETAHAAIHLRAQFVLHDSGITPIGGSDVASGMA